MNLNLFDLDFKVGGIEKRTLKMRKALKTNKKISFFHSSNIRKK